MFAGPREHLSENDHCHESFTRHTANYLMRRFIHYVHFPVVLGVFLSLLPPRSSMVTWNIINSKRQRARSGETERRPGVFALEGAEREPRWLIDTTTIQHYAYALISRCLRALDGGACYNYANESGRTATTSLARPLKDSLAERRCGRANRIIRQDGFKGCD